MPDTDELIEDAPLTAEDVLLFGPVVEAQTWHPIWLEERRAPIAVAAGRPKLGTVFNSDGVGKAVIIRPCMSRGRAVRGLRPIYTPQMLENNSSVYDGWPMFCDHVPAELAQTLAKRGRSVKELGGQVLRGRWARDFVHEDDEQYGYQKGGTLAEIWATPFIRKLVGENASLLHTSIHAWPTSGKPGPCPWRPKLKGMLIEGIRRQPQGSVDYVVRGGAGGRLLVAESAEDEGAWPELGEWNEADTRFVVSLAESFYAARQMPEITLPTKPEDLKGWLAEHAPHLSPALEEAAAAMDEDGDNDADKSAVSKKNRRQAKNVVEESESGITEADVERLIEQRFGSMPSVEDFEQGLREQFDRTLQTRDQQRSLASRAAELIESAEGIPVTWKTDLKARYSMLPSGPAQALLVESEDLAGEDGKTLTEEQVLESRVKADLQHCRDLIAEAQGRPRVKGEGGARRDPTDDRAGTARPAESSFWRSRFVEMGLAESEDKAVEAFGGKVSG